MRSFNTTAATMGVVAVIGIGVVARPSLAENVAFEIDSPAGMIFPGTTFSVLVLLEDNTTPLVGYTLDVDVSGVPAMHSGSVTANVGMTNFLNARNLIEQDPDDSLAPNPFSTIDSQPDGGVLINAVSNSFGTVDLAVDGVSDGLAQVFFDVSDDALGTFQISLGPNSSLGDANFNAVSFTSERFEVVVDPVPAPGAALLALIGLPAAGWVKRRCR